MKFTMHLLCIIILLSTSTQLKAEKFNISEYDLIYKKVFLEDKTFACKSNIDCLGSDSFVEVKYVKPLKIIVRKNQCKVSVNNTVECLIFNLAKLYNINNNLLLYREAMHDTYPEAYQEIKEFTIYETSLFINKLNKKNMVTITFGGPGGYHSLNLEPDNLLLSDKYKLIGFSIHELLSIDDLP